MKHNIKNILVAACAIALSASAAMAQITSADNTAKFNYDGLRYKLTYSATNGATAAVQQAWDYDFNYQELSGEINIPEYVEYKGEKVPVVGIAANAFEKTPNITKITIPSTVTTIGASAFKDAKALEEVNFGNCKITTINATMFSGCVNLKRVDFPASATSWTTTGAFAGCSSLKSVTFPENSLLNKVTGGTSGNGAFNGCTALRSFTFPATMKTFQASYMFENSGVSTVTFLENTGIVDPAKNSTWLVLEAGYIFGNAPELKTVIFPTYIKQWKYDVNTYDSSGKVTSTTPYSRGFVKCPKLTDVIFPEGCTLNYTSTYLFQECNSLKNVVLPAAIKTMDNYTFNKCEALETVVMPAALTTLGTYTFNECTALKNVTFGNALTTFPGRTFSGCVSLESVELPKSLTKMNDYSLKMANGLKSIVIPEGVTEMNNETFYSAENLEYVVLPSTLTTLKYSFNVTNNSLKAIVARAAVPSTFGTPTSTAPLNYDQVTVYVPTEEAVELYKAKAGWSNFTNYVVAGNLTLPETATLFLNETRSLNPVVVNNVDESIEALPVIWKSSNPDAVSVDAQGNLTALALTADPVTVTGSLWGQVMTTTVNVVANPYMVTAYNMTLKPGDVISPSAFLAFNSNANPGMTLPQNPIFEWTFAKEGIVAVGENGMLRALKLGSTQATVSYRGATATAIVSVMPDGYLAMDSEATIGQGNSAQLNPAFIFNNVGDNFDASQIKWSSNADMIAFVDASGKVYGARQGQAVITADYFGKTAVCTVNVVPGEEVSVDTYTLIVHMPDAKGSVHVLNATDGMLVEFEAYEASGLKSVHHDNQNVSGQVNNNQYNVSNITPETPSTTLKIRY